MLANNLSLILFDSVACFSVHVRGSEYIPLLGSDDSGYSSALLGMPEVDL